MLRTMIVAIIPALIALSAAAPAAPTSTVAVASAESVQAALTTVLSALLVPYLPAAKRDFSSAGVENVLTGVTVVNSGPTTTLEHVDLPGASKPAFPTDRFGYVPHWKRDESTTSTVIMEIGHLAAADDKAEWLSEHGYYVPKFMRPKTTFATVTKEMVYPATATTIIEVPMVTLPPSFEMELLRAMEIDGAADHLTRRGIKNWFKKKMQDAKDYVSVFTQTFLSHHADSIQKIFGSGGAAQPTEAAQPSQWAY